MRRSLGRFSHPTIGHTSKQALLSSSSFDFSTSAGNGGGDGGGRGRGRGRGTDFPKFSLTDSAPGKTELTGPGDETSFSSSLSRGRGKSIPPNGGGDGGGRGRGRGRDTNFPKLSLTDSAPGKTELTGPGDETSFSSSLSRGRGKSIPPTRNLPPFSSFVASDDNRGTVAGHGRGTVQSSQFAETSKLGTSLPPPNPEETSRPRKPIFYRKDEQVDLRPKEPGQDQLKNQEQTNLPSSILSILSGAGRGKPTQATPAVTTEKLEEVNRHIKPRQPQPTSPKMSQEEAINKARGILSRTGDGGAQDSESRTEGGYRGVGTRGGRGRGQRGGWSGRGRGGGRGGGRGRGMAYLDDDDNEEEDDVTEEVAKANTEKLAKFLGPEKMDLLVEASEEAIAKALPSPEEDALIDAMHTNLLLECEPEYLMAEFDSNPDIDEKPAIPLRDALEKMKPFLMAYENIQTNKEWEEAVEETMKDVPMMKELVDYYSGARRVTAKKQQGELERVAETLPASAPSSIKRFTDRAVVSLQSNPGWGFDKKCQFMDKLVYQVSQGYK